MFDFLPGVQKSFWVSVVSPSEIYLSGNGATIWVDILFNIRTAFFATYIFISQYVLYIINELCI